MDNDPEFESQVVLFPYTTEFEVVFGGRWFDKIPIDLYSDQDSAAGEIDNVRVARSENTEEAMEEAEEEETKAERKRRKLEERLTNKAHKKLMESITEEE